MATRPGVTAGMKSSCRARIASTTSTCLNCGRNRREIGMAKKFSALRVDMSPASRARSEARYREMLESMPLM